MYTYHRMRRLKWLQMNYCRGEEKGMELRAFVESETDLPDLMESEISSMLVPIIMIIGIMAIIVIGLLIYLVRLSLAHQLVRYLSRDTDTGSERDIYAATNNLERENKLIARIKDHELQTIKMTNVLRSQEKELKCAQEEVKCKTAWSNPSIVIQLRQEIAQKDAELMIANERLGEWQTSSGNTKNTAPADRDYQQQLVQEKYETEVYYEERIALHHNEIQKYKQDIMKAEQHVVDSKNKETEACELQKQESLKHHDLVAIHGDLLIQYESLKPKYQALLDEKQALDLKLQELITDNKGIARQHEDLVGCYQASVVQNQAHGNETEQLKSQLCDLQDLYEKTLLTLRTIQQESNEASGRAVFLQMELDKVKSSADRIVKEAQDNLARETEAEAGLRQTLHDIKSACDITLEEERKATQRARQQVEDLTAHIGQLKDESEDLQSRITMTVRDSQRKHEETLVHKHTIEILECRLSRLENRDRTQDIPKRQTGNIGSIATALDQCRVQLSEKETENHDLRCKLEQCSQAPGGGVPEDGHVAKERYEKALSELDNVKRQHTENQILWARRNSELDKECQKLRVSLSNAEAENGGRRPFSRRPPNTR
ncbi:hypothetical protein FE257_008418 [Aspergillus nanangensis]|uniref:Uncharacterized protein n=1 Tax=Aspergillus nanangensis TaxID=2582783 RepID=A0AAD4CLD2_ASPNN|nr:hypothetical protein FE257_008418 [Aspergillus nanangensis]